MKGMFEVLETIPRKLLEKTQALSIIPLGPVLKTGNHFHPVPLCQSHIIMNIFCISLFSQNQCPKQYQNQILVNRDKKKMWSEQVNQQAHSCTSSIVLGTRDIAINTADLSPSLCHKAYGTSGSMEETGFMEWSQECY
ncbi:hypothetical protein HJG60_008655 [Phyllostomus discolor]|uniref:Uncharacterized protein n=1 Tax=Phyllostomus discolor TaxID=89673 RepID=A0A833YT41_9CHIR|nr:hypothetical protein HJG60_008655 [Phyllostomus discolor]